MRPGDTRGPAGRQATSLRNDDHRQSHAGAGEARSSGDLGPLGATLVIAGVGLLLYALFIGSRPGSTAPMSAEPASDDLAQVEEPVDAAAGLAAAAAPPPAADPPAGRSDALTALPPLRHVWAEQPYTVMDGHFTLATTMPDLPEVRCDYRIPCDEAGIPLPTAEDIVLCFPFPTERCATEGIAKQLTDRWGFTTMTLRFEGFRPEDGVPWRDRSRWYYWPESGSGAAWLAALERVRGIGGLGDREVFAWGRSGGASAAHLFANAYPDKVAAVVQEASRVHAENPVLAGPVLLLHGHHDYVAEAGAGFEHRMRSAGGEITRIGFPPSWGGRGKNLIWQHSIHGPAAQFMWHWLTAVANLRIDHQGRIPPMHSWPVVEGTRRFPDQRSRETYRRITPSARFEAIDGARLAIANPAPARQARALVVQAVERFESSIEQCRLDAEYLAGNDCLTISASADGAPVAEGLRRALARGGYPEDLAWHLVMDGAEDPLALLTLRERPPTSISACNMSPDALRELARVCRERELSLAVIESEPRLTQLRSELSSDGIRWQAVVDEIDLLNHHRERSRAILAMIGKAKRRSGSGRR